MFKNFKVNTAVLICAAFILKLLVVNAGLISLNGKNTVSAKTHQPVKSKTTNLETSAASGNAEYSAEICEEDSDEETQLKTNPFLLMQIPYSFIGANSIGQIQKTFPLQRNFSFTETNRYIALNVFRI